MDQTKEWPIKIRRVTVTDKKTGTKYIEEEPSTSKSANINTIRSRSTTA